MNMIVKETEIGRYFKYIVHIFELALFLLTFILLQIRNIKYQEESTTL